MGRATSVRPIRHMQVEMTANSLAPQRDEARMRFTRWARGLIARSLDNLSGGWYNYRTEEATAVSLLGCTEIPGGFLSSALLLALGYADC